MRQLQMPNIYKFITLILIIMSPNVIASNTIALIGDNYREQVFKDVLRVFNIKGDSIGNKKKVRLKETGDAITTLLPGASNIQIANQLRKSDIAVIVVDSTMGPLPIDRDHIIIARQARVPVIVVLLANLRKLHSAAPKDAVELLELEELEMRELLSNYEVGGDSTLVFYDRKSTYSGPSPSGMGINEVFNVLAKIKANRSSTNRARNIKEFSGSFYLLTQAEANNKGIFLSKGKTISVWSEGTDSISTVISDGNYKPGDVTELNIQVNHKLSGNEGSRILLLQNGHLVGIGVIAKIHR
jgi:translation elongation factor EF-Tu-like GTPase